jgi:hypothetical protein
MPSTTVLSGVLIGIYLGLDVYLKSGGTDRLIGKWSLSHGQSCDRRTGNLQN